MQMRRLLAIGAALALITLAGWQVHARRAALHQHLQEKMAENAAPLAVQVEPARRGAIEVPLELTGTVKSDQQSGVTCNAPGVVERVLANVGDTVRLGQRLVILRSDKLSDAVAQAEAAVRLARARYTQARLSVGIQQTQTSTSTRQAGAALEAARAQLMAAETAVRLQTATSDTTIEQARAGLRAAEQRLALVREGPRKQERQIARDAAEQARVNLETAQRTLDRVRRLLDMGAVAPQTFDETKLQRDIAQQQYNQAQQQQSLVAEGARSQDIQVAEADVARAGAVLDMAKAAALQNSIREEGARGARQEVAQAEETVRMAGSGKARNTITEADVRAAAAAVGQAEAALALARHQLSDAVVRSPMAARVAARSIEPGEMAQPGSPLLVLVDNKHLYLEAEVPQERLGLVRVGMPVTVSVPGAGDRYPGNVYTVNPAVRADVRVTTIRIRFEDSSGRARAGMFAKAVLVSQRVADALIVPDSALHDGDGGAPSVFVAVDGVAQRRIVTKGLQNQARCQISSGLREGEQIIVTGQAELHDGRTVRVVPGGAGS